MKSAFESQDLNFIPDDIVEKRRLQASSKANFKTSLFFLIVSIIASAGLFYYNTKLVEKNTKIKDEITKYEEEVERLADFGKQGFVLGLRLDNIKKVLEKRSNYSTLVYEIAKRTPEDIIISGYNVSRAGEMSISAVSITNFTPISEFKDQLLNEDDEDDGLFPVVKINSASLGSGNVDFDLDVKVNEEKLYEDIK